LIELKDIYYSYGNRMALCGISLQVREGEHLTLVGPNASGKSTLAWMMNALLLPDKGSCAVDGIDTRENPGYARRKVAMVFQNPEDQIMSRNVRDDVAFGPRNLGFPPAEVDRRVKLSLEALGLEEYAGRNPHTLSGGQKQLLAIAGALAMEPSYIVLDEPTALLDGAGARAVRDAAEALKRRGKGIVWITHDTEEAMTADVIAVLKDGKVLASGAPDEIFNSAGILAESGIEAPYTWRLKSLMKNGPAHKEAADRA
jgi:energy-coupling factor transport system ATP-binding protein